jgi:very-short-patch-repair endonuclease
MKSKLEEMFAQQIAWTNLPRPEREYRFHPKRKWRLDFAWPSQKLALEVEGGIWIKGRHTHPVGFTKDKEKYNAATILGWRLLRVDNHDIENGVALDLIITALQIDINAIRIVPEVPLVAFKRPPQPP